MSGSKAYDKLLEKATSSLLLEVDWESILRMCDLIRQGDVQAKYAITQVKKKLNHENMNTVLFSLQCLESMVKNCGSKIHQEMATKDTMEVLRSLALAKSDPIKIKILELIQCWAHAFKKNPNYKIVEDYYNSMKLEGFQYPALKESEAMFDVEEAPVWTEDAEASCCFRCRSEFSTLKRRHHCRACGQIFCNACSSKTAPIPKYGIEKEVRVCDLCYDKLTGNSSMSNVSAAAASFGGSSSQSNDQLPAEYVNSALFKESLNQSNKKPAEKSEQEFEDELQLALAISQSEAEAQESTKRRSSLSNGHKSSTSNGSQKNFSSQPKNFEEPRKSSLKTKSNPSSENLTSASAPYLESSKTPSIQQAESVDNGQILLASQSEEEIKINNEIDAFVDSTKKTLEIYINRMKSDSLRGRSITNDTAVQSLFLQLQHMHPKLLSYIQYQEDARGYYENLQDKLTQLKDAREALNALRHENYEKKKRDLEEKERQRQSQIALKLQHMRQQKQNYYQYQNQLNLQQLQEKERELQMRIEQQRQLVIQRDQQFLGQNNGLPFNQTIPNVTNNVNQLPYNMSGMPSNYQQYMENNNFQSNSSPSKLASVMGNLSLQNNQNLNESNSQYQQSQFKYLNQQGQIQSNQYSNQEQYQISLSNGQMQHINGQIPPINGQMQPINGQIPPINGQIPPINGQIPPINGQITPVNGQITPVNGQMVQINSQEVNNQPPTQSSIYQQPMSNFSNEIPNQPEIKQQINEAQLISFD